MGRAEAHLGLDQQLVVHVGAVRMEGGAHPDGAPVVGPHQHRLVPFLPLGIPVAVLHLVGLVLQRQREGLGRGGQVLGVVLRCRHIGLQAVPGLDEALVGALVAQRVHQHVAEDTGIVHRKGYFNVFHS